MIWHVGSLAVALALATTVQAQSSTASAAISSASSSASIATSTSASSSAGSTNAATSLLPVPTQAGAQYNATEAKNLAQYLPGYTYNLTQESIATRTGICNQTTAFCASAKCTSQTANVTVNFCNINTMGWNCECNDGAQSRLQPLVVPVNTYDCRLRTQACLEACQNSRSSVPVTNLQQCQNACNYVIGATCGTNAQQLPEYQVSKEGDTPKYYPDTSKGGVAIGVSAGTSSFGLCVALPLIGAVFGGLALLT